MTAPVHGRERRARARKGEGGRLRDDILTATESLLLASGDSSSISIRAIASAVGVTPPSIYIHFADRNELIFAVCDRQWRQLEARLDAAAAAADDPVERVVRRGRAYVEFGLTHPEHYRILLMSRDAEVPARYADRALFTQRLAFDPLVADLRAAMDAGDIVATDPLELCLVLFGAVHGLTSLLVTKASFDWPPVDDMFDRLVNTLLTGLRPRDRA
jgi:AcrR family transcriptional regulator